LDIILRACKKKINEYKLQVKKNKSRKTKDHKGKSIAILHSHQKLIVT